MEDKDVPTDAIKAHLKLLLKDLGISNHSVSVTPFDMNGKSFMGIITKVRVEGFDVQNNVVELNLVWKRAPQTEAYRDVFPVHECYKREIYIYSQLIPEIKILQEDRNILKPFNSYPKFYSSVIDDLNEFIILQDMSQMGYRLPSPDAPLDFDHLQLVMREFGKFHALSFALRDQKPELFQQLCNNTKDSYFRNMNLDFVNSCMHSYSEIALSSLDPITHKHAYEKFNAYRENYFTFVERALNSDLAGRYGVVTHGDIWLNNMLFKYKDDSKSNYPTKVCLLDWQASRLATPVLDISCFIFTCSDKRTREAHYEELIETYYDTLSSMLYELGSNPKKLFPFAVLQEHLKKFSSYGLFMTVIILLLLFGHNEEESYHYDIENKEEVKRSFDLKIKDKDGYNDRMRGVILDYIKYGYEC